MNNQLYCKINLIENPYKEECPKEIWVNFSLVLKEQYKTHILINQKLNIEYFARRFATNFHYICYQKPLNICINGKYLTMSSKESIAKNKHRLQSEISEQISTEDQESKELVEIEDYIIEINDYAEVINHYFPGIMMPYWIIGCREGIGEISTYDEKTNKEIYFYFDMENFVLSTYEKLLSLLEYVLNLNNSLIFKEYNSKTLDMLKSIQLHWLKNCCGREFSPLIFQEVEDFRNSICKFN